MVYIFYDKVKPDNVWLVKGMGYKEAKQQTDIPFSRVELLKAVSNSEIRVLSNAPVIAIQPIT